MTNTYDTNGEPLGSTSVKVLYNNASNLDDAVNGPALTWPDRFSVMRKSWAGIEEDWRQFLLNSGYEFIGDYDTDGPLLIERPNQVFTKDGEYWRSAPTLTLPYTTVNNWVVDEPKFVSTGDASLRQALANSADPAQGAGLVARAIRHINSVTELQALVGKYNGEIVYLRGRSAALLDVGAGLFVFDTASVATADDGTIFTASGGGRWRRKVDAQEINSAWFGASSVLVDATAQMQAAVNAAIAYGLASVRLPGTGYFKVSALTGTAGITFRGQGAFFDGYLFPVVQDKPSDPPLITLPAAYSWYPGKIYANGLPGQVVQTADVEKMWLDNEVQGTVVYYISPTGSDANSGSTLNSPLKTLVAAIAKASVGVIKCYPGTYYGGIGTAIGVTVNRDIEISSLSGGPDVIVRTGVDSAGITWTLNTGATYEAVTGLAINQAFDGTIVDGRGDPFRLTLRGSIATVNANPGSWWYDSAVGKVYVRMPIDGSPSGKVVLFGSAAGTVTGNRALFCKNIKFHGGGIALADSGGVRPRLYMKDCEQKYGANNGIQTLAGIAYLQRVTLALSALDNANYHDNAGLASRALEIDCVSYGSGYLLSGSPSETMNASSMHDTGVVLRINGQYSESWGPNIPDTGSSTSWNIGVSVKDALGSTASSNNGFYTETAMTLIDCAASGNTYDLRVATGGVMSVRNPQTGGTKLLEGTGKLQQV